jgi:hypothetical protein
MITKEKIQEWNGYFNSLSSEEKRVAIAKDVIAQIEANIYISRRGIYGSIYSNNSENPLDRNISVQTIFDEVACNCCALGAMFMSNVKFNNQCTVDDVGRPVKMLKDLTNFFSVEQLIMIECAFENWSSSDVLGDVDDDYEEDFSFTLTDGIHAGSNINALGLSRDKLVENVDNAYKFGSSIEKNEERLIEIMNNIIENNGEFIPN